MDQIFLTINFIQCMKCQRRMQKKSWQRLIYCRRLIVCEMALKKYKFLNKTKQKKNKALRPSDEFPSNLSNFHRSEFIAKTSGTTVIPSYLPVVQSLMHINIFPQFKTFSSSISSFENKITMMWVKGIFNVIQWARMWAAFHMRHKKRK